MTAKLDEQTERAITGVAIAAVRQFRDKADRAETRAATTALRQRIRELIDEAVLAEKRRILAGLQAMPQ